MVFAAGCFEVNLRETTISRWLEVPRLGCAHIRPARCRRIAISHSTRRATCEGLLLPLADWLSPRLWRWQGYTFPCSGLSLLRQAAMEMLASMNRRLLIKAEQPADSIGRELPHHMLAARAGMDAVFGCEDAAQECARVQHSSAVAASFACTTLRAMKGMLPHRLGCRSAFPCC